MITDGGLAMLDDGSALMIVMMEIAFAFFDDGNVGWDVNHMARRSTILSSNAGSPHSHSEPSNIEGAFIITSINDITSIK